MESQQLMCVCGFEGSGKNAVSSILEKQYGFFVCSFADNLKKAIAAIFGWEYEMLLGITDASRFWREQVDEYWSDELSMPGLTPRKVLQLVGTDVMRVHFHDSIWIKSLKKKVVTLLNQGHSVVITDCRFTNEAHLVKSMGGKVVLVNRDATAPKWLELYYRCRDEWGSSDPIGLPGEEFCNKFYKLYGIHPAETSMIGYEDYNHILYNENTTKDLEDEIKSMFNQM